MTQNELSAEQKSFFKKIVRDPVLFATYVLGVDLWEREAEILRSIKSHRRTAVKACHGVGKTFTKLWPTPIESSARLPLPGRDD